MRKHGRFWPAVSESSSVPCVSAALQPTWLLKVHRKWWAGLASVLEIKNKMKLQLTLLSPGLFSCSCQCLPLQLTHQLHLSRLPCDFWQINKSFRAHLMYSKSNYWQAFCKFYEGKFKTFLKQINENFRNKKKFHKAVCTALFCHLSFYFGASVY